MANTTRDPNQQAMDLIKASGVLNPNMTMDKLMELTQKLMELEPPSADLAAAAKHVDTFIHKHFIYRHEE